jgi:serine/threonine protein kinase/tetratricopeptide (TPR) repeat protein
VTERDIFHAGLDIADPTERMCYLDAACAGDPALKQRFLQLLQMHDQLGSFLQAPAAQALLQAHDGSGELPAVNPERTGTHDPAVELGQVFAGRYKLRQKLGEGGMGVVFVADQTEPVQRRVALKVIRAGLDTHRLLARFEQERQALALMDHPNIAKVFDAGIDGEPGRVSAGRPYFAMELVKGLPLTKYCDDARLSPRERLQLFIPVCQAVQHAHQKGIIHRDLKPSNILVGLYDGRPVPKVIDFGVAKVTGPRLTEQSVYTEVGSMIGTLEYMSPEQAELDNLDIDTRSDIYTLGVILYELLTGAVPISRKDLEKAGLAEMLRVIKEVEPAKPSTKLSHADTLPSIAAHRQMEPRKLTKLVRGELDWIVMKALEKDRNRRYESANGFAMDVQRYLADEPVLAGPPSAGYRLRKFVRRNKGPVLASGMVALTLVVGIIGTTLGLIEARHQRDAAQAAAVAATKAKETAQSREAATRAVLEFVESRIIAAARPEGQGGGLGSGVTLRRALEAALPFLDQSFHDQPLIEARLRLMLARSFGNLGEAKIAADQAEKARAIYSQHCGPDHPDTLSSMHNLAICYEALGWHDDALKLRELTLALMRAKLGPDDRKTLMAMNELALSYNTLGQHDEALKLLETALALSKTRFGQNHPNTLGKMNNLALTYSHLGRHDAALKLAQETLALSKARFPPDWRTTLSMDTLAYIYHAAGQHGEAIKLYREAVALMKDKLSPDHPITLSTMHGLANTYAAAGRHDEAVKLYEQTLELQKTKLKPEDHPDTLSTMNKLARLLATSSDPKIRNASRAVELSKKAVGLAPREGRYWNTLGVAHYHAGDWKAAIGALSTSMELRKGGDSFDWLFLAMAHWKLGEKEKAREWHDKAVEWMDKNQPKNEELRRFRAESSQLLERKEKN